MRGKEKNRKGDATYRAVVLPTKPIVFDVAIAVAVVVS